MPIYEYQCQNCGKQHEVLQKFSDPELTDCPVCQTPNLKKLISAAGFQLKGNGWYVTDFRNKEQKSKQSSVEDCGKNSCATTGTCQGTTSND
jgi:putative FmdB family regulatory protein